MSVGRPREDASGAADGGATELARGGDLEGGWRALDVLDVVDEQRLPWPVNRRQGRAGGEYNHASLGHIVLDAGRQACS
jgi:hypothetical protein